MTPSANSTWCTTWVDFKSIKLKNPTFSHQSSLHIHSFKHMNVNCLITSKVHKREFRRMEHSTLLSYPTNKIPPRKNKTNQVSVVLIGEKPYRCSLWFDLLLLVPSHPSRKVLLPIRDIKITSMSCSMCFVDIAKWKVANAIFLCSCFLGKCCCDSVMHILNSVLLYAVKCTQITDQIIYNNEWLKRNITYHPLLKFLFAMLKG